jgi:phosphoglycerate dehydrogenase-like enzyme
MLLKGNPPIEAVWLGEPRARDRSRVEAIVTVKRRVGSALLRRYPNARVIAVAFTGYDCVKLTAEQLAQVRVYNVPGYAADATAEHAVGLALSLLRGTVEADRWIRAKKWRKCREWPPGAELRGMSVGVLGTGDIGMRAARLFHAFGCRLVGWSRTRKQEFRRLGGRYLATIDAVCKAADILSIHLPLMDKTKGVVGARQLLLMKPTAYLVNTSRGAIVDQAFLAQRLREGRLAGAALDVFSTEPLPPGDLLRDAPRLILTPHISYRTTAALRRRAEITVANVRRGLLGRTQNSVTHLLRGHPRPLRGTMAPTGG